jgi:hypothetical protein
VWRWVLVVFGCNENLELGLMVMAAVYVGMTMMTLRPRSGVECENVDRLTCSNEHGGAGLI